MSEAQYSREFFERYHEVNKELVSLEGKDEEESEDRRTELIDELLTMDMALGPVRKAMIEAAKKKGLI